MTVKLKANEYWGRRSGSVRKNDGSLQFIQQQWGHGKESKEPKKRGLQWYLNRRGRSRVSKD